MGALIIFKSGKSMLPCLQILEVRGTGRLDVSITSSTLAAVLNRMRAATCKA